MPKIKDNQTALEKLGKLIAEINLIPKVKQPRHYADEILKLRTKEERRAALEQVPEEMRQTVKFYVHDHFAKRHKKPLPDLKKERTAIQQE